MISKEKIIGLVGEEWAKVLEEYTSSEAFSRLGNRVAALRQTHTVYPDKELVFRAFKEVPYSKVKVIIIGLNPFDDGNADGLSFSNSISNKTSPALNYMLQEVDNNYPEWKDDIGYGRLDKQDLSRWCKQGVLMLNVALTVQAFKPGSHLGIWKDFTNFVVSKLNEQYWRIWVLLGKEAQKLKPLITHPSQIIIEAEHPMVHYYGRRGFLGSEIFKKVNTQLEAINKSIIQW